MKEGIREQRRIHQIRAECSDAAVMIWFSESFGTLSHALACSQNAPSYELNFDLFPQKRYFEVLTPMILDPDLVYK
jgi:hypothetical protein